MRWQDMMRAFFSSPWKALVVAAALLVVMTLVGVSRPLSSSYHWQGNHGRDSAFNDPSATMELLGTTSPAETARKSTVAAHLFVFPMKAKVFFRDWAGNDGDRPFYASTRSQDVMIFWMIVFALAAGLWFKRWREILQMGLILMLVSTVAWLVFAATFPSLFSGLNIGWNNYSIVARSTIWSEAMNFYIKFMVATSIVYLLVYAWRWKRSQITSVAVAARERLGRIDYQDAARRGGQVARRAAGGFQKAAEGFSQGWSDPTSSAKPSEPS